MRNETYKKYRAMGYEASEALRLARLPKYDYGLNSSYDYMQKEQTIDVPELSDGYEIKLQCFYEDYAEVPWDFYESNGEVIVDSRYEAETGNGNVDLWHGGYSHNSYRYAWQDAVRKTRKEFDEYRPKWGKTMRQDYALERVRSEFKYFKDFCRGDWGYIWIKASLWLDGENVAEESIGGVESTDHWKECAEDVIWQLVKEAKARTYAGSTVGCV
jgi:hypothetical protein